MLKRPKIIPTIKIEVGKLYTFTTMDGTHTETLLCVGFFEITDSVDTVYYAKILQLSKNKLLDVVLESAEKLFRPVQVDENDNES